MTPNEKLISLRKSSGMNRRQFSAYLGIPYDTVSSWETGKHRIPEYVYELIAFKMAARECVLERGEPEEDPGEQTFEQITFEDYLATCASEADTRYDFMPWITRDDEELRLLSRQGLGVSQIAARLHRSEEKVAARMKRLRIK